MTLLTAFAVVLIMAPGDYVDVDTWFRACPTEWERQCKELYLSTNDRHDTLRAFEHGWPRPFLARILVFEDTLSDRPHRVLSTPLIRFPGTFSWGGPIYVWWSNYDNWPISADEWMLDPWSLAIDIAVAVLILGTVGVATEWWIRNRSGRFQYRMADIFAAVTLIGVLLAVYTYHARIRRLEAQGGAPSLSPSFVSHDGDLTSSQRYFGPVWMRKLVGHADLLPLFHHVDSVSVGHGDQRLEVYQQLPALPYLESVWVRDVLPLEAIEQLAHCRRLKELRLPWPDSNSAVTTPSTSVPLLGAGDLPLLERLHLTTVGLSGDHILAEHLEQVASFPTIRRIWLRTPVTWAAPQSPTPEEIDAIRAQHPAVEIVLIPTFLSP